ncbi:hypothetical protein PRUPE_3G282500 [Prunus persica]|uniref:Uncharacterized protein n=1 Tax=Prunus persica TaxID=3760 RepID=A0A251QA25_PRUPE|nr:hypothetical protein PRUPE_3G282500 [Prunus persica]
MNHPSRKLILASEHQCSAMIQRRFLVEIMASWHCFFLLNRMLRFVLGVYGISVFGCENWQQPGLGNNSIGTWNVQYEEVV